MHQNSNKTANQIHLYFERSCDIVAPQAAHWRILIFSPNADILIDILFLNDWLNCWNPTTPKTYHLATLDCASAHAAGKTKKLVFLKLKENLFYFKNELCYFLDFGQTEIQTKQTSLSVWC
jgi:hypothetical protein